MEQLLGAVSYAEAFALEPGDPALARRAVRGHREADDSVLGIRYINVGLKISI